MTGSENDHLKEKAQGDLTFFERVTEKVSGFLSSPAFFAGLVVFMVGWLVAGIYRSIAAGSYEPMLDAKYQLFVNSPTTIVTTLAVAILENATRRFENSVNIKLNAQSDALADLMEMQAREMNTGKCDQLLQHAKELREAVGVELKVSA